MTIFRPFNEKWQNDWKDKNNDVPVNRALFVLSSEEEEDKFVKNIYPNSDDRQKYLEYRNEWYRRAKEFDEGKYPLSVNCELVSTCNLACTMCYTITDKFQNSVVGAQRMLPWEILTKIIDEAAELGVPSISFSWRGESTMYRVRDKNNEWKDFADAINYADKKGILETTSLTHGQLIDEKMAEKIVLANPSWISFSIDGIHETYNKIRTPANKLEDKNFNAFDVVCNSIKLLNKYKKLHNKTRPSIRTNTIFPAIQHNPEEYKNFMKNLGVDLITVNEMKDYRFHELPNERIQDNWGCQYPFQRLTVSANGIIIPCTGAYNEEEGLVLGKYDGSKDKVIRDYKGKIVKQNLDEFNLTKAWNSERLKKIRFLHKNGKRKEIDPGCKNCHHGTVHHGVDHLPKQWNAKEQQWSEHKILSKKRNYHKRGNQI